MAVEAGAERLRASDVATVEEHHHWVMILSRDAAPEIGGRLVRVLAAARPRIAGGALRLAMLLAAAYVYILRQPTVLMAPTLWAEDGTIFLKGALEHGPGTLFEPYSGQIFVFPRIVALLAAPLPVSIQPAIYAAVAVAAAVLSCSIVLSSRWRFSVPLSARFLCLLALLCSPAVEEVFGTLSNAHWWLAIGLVLLGMLSDPLSRRGKSGELAFTALTALSGFAAIYALPSLAVRSFRNRSRHSLALLGVALAGILVQVGYLLHSTRLANGVGMLFEHPITEVIALVRRVFAGSVLGDTNLALLWPNRLPDTWVWLLPIALIVALTAVWIRAPRIEVAALLLALLGGTALAIWAVADPTLNSLWWAGWGGRYFVDPMAMLYVSLIVSWLEGTLRRTMAGLACVLLATGILSDYHLNPLPYVDWTPFAACVEKHTTTCTTVIPPDWQLEINPPSP
jgi:hypothetical protein